VAMFELNVFTPAQFGALIPYLIANRGNLSMLVHPNTSTSALQDHTEFATWIGDKVPLDVEVLKPRASHGQTH
jgi:aromatic ring-cleaving dioxygenase